MSDCPCGSGSAFAECCEPVISGARSAETAEQTMRARYSAHVHVDPKFLAATLHPDTRQEDDEETARRWAEESEWLGLEVLATEAGGPDDEEGTVEFRARYRDKRGRLQTHHEVSAFAKAEGEWRFKDALTPEQEPVRRDSAKVGRNDPCSCGSGRKYKKCCGKGA